MVLQADLGVDVRPLTQKSSVFSISLHIYFFQNECGTSDVSDAHQLCSVDFGNPL